MLLWVVLKCDIIRTPLHIPCRAITPGGIQTCMQPFLEEKILHMFLFKRILPHHFVPSKTVFCLSASFNDFSSFPLWTYGKPKCLKIFSSHKCNNIQPETVNMDKEGPIKKKNQRNPCRGGKG